MFKSVLICLLVVCAQFGYNNADCIVQDNPYELLRCITINPQTLVSLLSNSDITGFCTTVDDYMNCMRKYITGCIGGKAALGALDELAELNYKCCISKDTSKCVTKNPELVKNCIASDNMITLADNTQKQIIDVKVGDLVKAINSYGEVIDSEIVAIMHKETNGLAKFVNLESANGQFISLTDGHLINIKNKGYIKAASVKVGDIMNVFDGENLIESEIVKIESDYKLGYIAPLTESGTILVNGIHASCYSEVNSHQLAHFAMKPLAFWHKLTKYFGNNVESTNGDGLHHYAKLLHDITVKVLPSLLV